MSAANPFLRTSLLKACERPEGFGGIAQPGVQEKKEPVLANFHATIFGDLPLLPDQDPNRAERRLIQGYGSN